ncbi:MAG: PTS system mannose/fructose/sorbose family transporter subunit IID [Elusimicrobiota bacterium]|jgi:PTS system mannose-specific IID component|nr:PTS system mannose/fructose/sorbose family transporter subunit IID [Elusimicrobiota bacterium]
MKNKLRIFFRSYLLQGFWNYAQMQNIGLLFILMPNLEDIYKDNKDGLANAVARNLEAFNSNPILSSYAIGAMLRQEEKLVSFPPAILANEEREFRIIRATTANTAAAIGDRLFWGVLKPLSLLLCLLVLFVCEVQICSYNFTDNNLTAICAAGLALSLLAYNIPAVFVRLKGLKDGYNGNENNFYGLIRVNWNKMIYALKISGQICVIIVIFLGLYSRAAALNTGAEYIIGVSLLVAFMFMSVLMRKFHIPNVVLYLLASAIFAAASFLD